ncbi:hypothetical protein PML80_08240 [Aerococcus urinaeequi]|uniref:Uncharacterized protein n=1 Tax=Aerococcus urinaeequi TaxID=51665 RepID=A0AAE9XHL0_9LACT|nr:hypothetical protein [Aerococcus urinaeequi]WCG37497.1 hypothetical protein PML80_08240 [Aerococcus urinaeequi]
MKHKQKQKQNKYLNIYFWIAIIIYISLVIFFPGNRTLEIFGLVLVFLFFLIRLILRKIAKY